MTKPLDGRLALVTGASRGIGAAAREGRPPPLSACPPVCRARFDRRPTASAARMSWSIAKRCHGVPAIKRAA